MVARAWRQGKSLGKLSAARSIAFQSFIKSFPSFGREFDSHRPLQKQTVRLRLSLPSDSQFRNSLRRQLKWGIRA